MLANEDAVEMGFEHLAGWGLFFGSRGAPMGLGSCHQPGLGCPRQGFPGASRRLLDALYKQLILSF